MKASTGLVMLLCGGFLRAANPIRIIPPSWNPPGHRHMDAFRRQGKSNSAMRTRRTRVKMELLKC